MRLIVSLFCTFSLNAAASAHDFWLEPQKFHIRSTTPLTVDMFIGHGADRDRWGVRGDHVAAFFTIGPDGERDHRRHIGPVASVAMVPIDQAGDHLLILESANALSQLPPDKFIAYAQEEGLVLDLEEGLAARAEPVREIYRRRARTLVRVGEPGDGFADSHVTTALGRGVEIVPGRNPYNLAETDILPVTVLSDGAPLAGATVHVGRLDQPGVDHAQYLTDTEGRVELPFAAQGRWFLGVVWSKPAADGVDAEFDTTFASLTFGFPDTSGADPQ